MAKNTVRLPPPGRSARHLLKAACATVLRVGLIAALLGAMIAGCDSSNGGARGSSTTAAASISGTLLVLDDSEAPTVVEQEPNDVTDQSQFTGLASDGSQWSILGTIAEGPPDNDVDAFRFTARRRLRVDVNLTLENAPAEGAAFDVGVVDFTQNNCSLGDGPNILAACFEGTPAGTTGSWIVIGSFALVVVPRGDGVAAGPYRLDVACTAVMDEFGPPAPVDRGAVDRGHLARRSAGRNLAQIHGGPGAAAADGRLEAGGTRGGLEARGPRRGLEGPRGEFAEGEVLVAFAAGVAPASRAEVLVQAGMEMALASDSGVCRVRCPLPSDADALTRRMLTYKAALDLQSVPGIRVAEPNYLLHATAEPNDEFFNLQWHYPTINLPEAWDITTGSDDVVVAIIDTGALYDHPDLGPRLIESFDFISDPLTALDGDGIDGDASDPGDSPNAPTGSSFHGTHVAGTIGAVTNNGSGVAGVTWAAQIMPVRALGRAGTGSSFDIGEAVRYAAGLPNVSQQLPARSANVINMSLSGGAGNPPAECVLSAIGDAVAAGVVVCAASGNDGSSEPDFPAASDSVIAVGAVDLGLNRASYSNFGVNVDLVAPGGDLAQDLDGDGNPDGVLSTIGSDVGNRDTTFEFAFSNGTSMACPHAAGVAALMLSANPALTPAEIRDILSRTATDLGAAGSDEDFGAGLVNAAAAVREAQLAGDEPAPPPPQTPQLSLSTSSVDFGMSQTSTTIAIVNTGGGFLQVDAPQIQEFSGTAWLDATLAGGGETSSADQLVVSVTRAGLTPGDYRGAVTLSAASTGTAQVEVVMSVADPESAASSETIFVLLVTPDTYDTVATADTDAVRGFQFELPEVEPGDYVIFAGTDRDLDDLICDTGELCGSPPSVIDPAVIHVSAGERLTGIDFSVTEVILQTEAAAFVNRPLRRR